MLGWSCLSDPAVNVSLVADRACARGGHGVETHDLKWRVERSLSGGSSAPHVHGGFQCAH